MEYAEMMLLQYLEEMLMHCMLVTARALCVCVCVCVREVGVGREM